MSSINSNQNSISKFNLKNRKYIGSKVKLLDFIENVIKSEVPQINVFIDAFSGTGVVAEHFTKFSNKVIANDLLFSNYITNKTFLNSKEDEVDIDKIILFLKKLNKLKGFSGYVSKNFGGEYFTDENAKLIDSIRENIESKYNDSILSLQEKYILLTSLLFAIDKVANTVGQYDAFLKHIGKSEYENGVHKIDSNVYKKMQLKLPDFVFDGKNEVYNEDINFLVEKLQGDVIYLDPPYNNRQYVDNYHLLENIMLWQRPELFGKTKKFNRDHLKSKYSRKYHAAVVFSALIHKIKCDHIFLSYNNEGIIQHEEIIDILKQKGPTKIYEYDYNVFGNGAGKSKKRKVVERMYYCRNRK